MTSHQTFVTMERSSELDDVEGGKEDLRATKGYRMKLVARTDMSIDKEKILAVRRTGGSGSVRVGGGSGK